MPRRSWWVELLDFDLVASYGVELASWDVVEVAVQTAGRGALPGAYGYMTQTHPVVPLIRESVHPAPRRHARLHR